MVHATVRRTHPHATARAGTGPIRDKSSIGYGVCLTPHRMPAAVGCMSLQTQPPPLLMPPSSAHATPAMIAHTVQMCSPTPSIGHHITPSYDGAANTRRRPADAKRKPLDIRRSAVARKRSVGARSAAVRALELCAAAGAALALSLDSPTPSTRLHKPAHAPHTFPPRGALRALRTRSHPNARGCTTSANRSGAARAHLLAAVVEDLELAPLQRMHLFE